MAFNADKRGGRGYWGERAEDLTGRQFGLLRVVQRVYPIGHVRETYYACECECGAVHVTRASRLRTGAVQACQRWCPAREVAGRRQGDQHGQSL